MPADTLKERRDGLRDERLNEAMTESGAGKVHVRSSVDNAHPLAMIAQTGKIVPGNLAGFGSAFERLIARAGEDEHGFADVVPCVLRKDNAGTLRRERDVCVEAILTCWRRRDADDIFCSGSALRGE